MAVSSFSKTTMSSNQSHYRVSKSFEDDAKSETSTAVVSNVYGGDDDLSVSSISSKYKLKKTYRKKTWKKIVKMGAVASVPTIGMAILAVLNPFLFLAGAGVASLLSVGVGGVYYCLWSTVEEEATVQKETNQNNELKEGKQVPDEMLSLADLTVMSEDTAIPVAEEKMPENPEGEDPVDKAKVKDEDEDEDDAYDIPDALSVTILNDCAFHGLNAKQFFQIFFGDNAPFSFQDFQEELGDKNVQYHPWQTQNNTTRLIEFETPTNSPFCKPYSRGTKQQNLLHRSNKCVVMESITSMQDVPFSDCFNVQEQWVITSNNGGDIRLKVTAQINFSKSCTFEYQIRSKTISTLQENLDAWHNVAQRAVRISQRQRQRQRQKEEQARQQKLLGSMECVEVQFSITSNGAFVVGEEEEQEEDWEMDPNPPPRKTKKTRRRRRASLGAIRNTFTKSLKVAKAR